MSKLVRLSFALMTAFLLFEAKLDAAKPAAKPTTKTVSSKPATKPVKATQSKPTTTKATKASKPLKTTKTTSTTTTAKAPKSSATKVAKTTNPKKSTTTTASTSTTTGSTTGGSTTSTTSTTTTTTTTHVGPEMNSKLQKKLGEDSKHAARLAAKLNLPAGITIQQAAAGFKNWGQFNAAVNLSNNLGIPFNDLKAALTGWTLPNAQTGVATKTTTGTMSLGQAQKAFSDGTLPTYPPPTGTTTTPTTTTQH